MDRDRLDARLEAAFDAPAGERRVVVRQAVDLADDGRYAATHGAALSADVVVRNLEDAPAGSGLVDRWNWWIGALEIAHGGYEGFAIRRWRGDADG